MLTQAFDKESLTTLFNSLLKHERPIFRLYCNDEKKTALRRNDDETETFTFVGNFEPLEDNKKLATMCSVLEILSKRDGFCEMHVYCLPMSCVLSVQLFDSRPLDDIQ